MYGRQIINHYRLRLKLFLAHFNENDMFFFFIFQCLNSKYVISITVAHFRLHHLCQQVLAMYIVQLCYHDLIRTYTHIIYK